MNTEDREEYKRLVAEAKEKQQDEISGEFIYLPRSIGVARG